MMKMKAQPISSLTGASLRLFSCALLAGIIAFPAIAENRSSLLSRLDRIEQRLAEVSATGPSVAVSGEGNTIVARNQVEIDRLQEDLRRLRGDIEELRHAQEMLKASLTRLEQDSDLRFEALEQTSTVPVLDDQVDEEAVFEAPSISLEDTAEASISETSNPSADYQAAFDALNQGDYAEAEAEFSAFIERFPEHSLVGNAYYWLGETYYVQQQHEAAAEQFRQGFQALPEGPKAPDNLLRLGMTLSVLERKDEACIIINQLLTKYKGRSESVLRKAERERERLACD